MIIFGYGCNPLNFLINFHRAEQEFDRLQKMQNHFLSESQMTNVLSSTGFEEKDWDAYEILLIAKQQLNSASKERE